MPSRAEAVALAAGAAVAGFAIGGLVAQQFPRRRSSSSPRVAFSDSQNEEAPSGPALNSSQSELELSARNKSYNTVLEERRHARRARSMTGMSPSSSNDDILSIVAGEGGAGGARPPADEPTLQHNGSGEFSLSPAAVSSRREHRKIVERTQTYGVGQYSQANKLVLVMVGLPARGKSYISHMIIRYLTWTGFPVRMFNVGQLRREKGMAGVSADFFKSTNKEAGQERERLAEETQDIMYDWLRQQPCASVAIFDATNTTIKRRKGILARCRRERGVLLVFLESICTDPEVLEANYRMKLNNDDYKNQDPAAARADFLERVREYEKRYETIGDDEGGGEISYMKLFNVGEKAVMRGLQGYLSSQIAFYLSNVHISSRKLWLTRHGESEMQLRGHVGAQTGELTATGKAYAAKLAAFIADMQAEMVADDMDNPWGATPNKSSARHSPVTRAARRRGSFGDPVGADDFEEGDEGDEGAPPGTGARGDDVLVFTGTSEVHRNTVNELVATGLYPCVETSLLNELGGGDFDGISYEEFKTNFPEVWAARERDKFHFRYPGAGGESYRDVIDRLRPIIIELERQRRSVLVVSHLAVQRCLYAYFTGVPMEQIPYIKLPQHVVVELEPGAHGTKVRHFNFSDGVKSAADVRQGV